MNNFLEILHLAAVVPSKISLGIPKYIFNSTTRHLCMTIDSKEKNMATGLDQLC